MHTVYLFSFFLYSVVVVFLVTCIDCGSVTVTLSGHLNTLLYSTKYRIENMSSKPSKVFSDLVTEEVIQKVSITLTVVEIDT